MMNFNKIFKTRITEEDQTDLLNKLIDNQEEEEEEEVSPDTDVDSTDDVSGDEDEETPEEKEADKEKEEENKEKQQVDDERNKKFEKYASKVVTSIKIQVSKNPRQLLDDFKVYGLDETIEKFLTGSFIPQLEDADEKVFLTLNMADFIPIVAAKLSDKFLKREEE